MSEDEKVRGEVVEWASRDPFLSSLDQQPLLEQSLAELDRAFAAFRARCAELLEARRTTLEEGIQGAKEALQGSTKALRTAFQSAASADRKSIQALVETCEKELARLYRNFHWPVQTRLQGMGPDSDSFSELLKILRKGYLEGTEIPDQLLLVQRRKERTGLQGRSVFDAEGPVLQEVAQRFRWNFLNRLRFTLARLRLRRRYERVRVPLAATVAQHLHFPDPTLEKDWIRAYRESHAHSLSRFEDAWQVTRFHLQLTTAEVNELLETDPGEEESSQVRIKVAELEELLLGALERAAEQLEGVLVPWSELEKELVEKIDATHREQWENIGRDIENAGTLRVRLRWLLRRLGKAAVLWKDGLASALASAREPVRRRAVAAFYEIEDLVYAVAFRLGLARPSKEHLLFLTDLPSRQEMAERSHSLPPVYRRLFSPEPLAMRELLVGRDKELQLLHGAVSRWQQRRISSAVIIGPEGSGKTSLLNCFERELDPRISLYRNQFRKRLQDRRELVETLGNWFELNPLPESPDQLVERLLQLPRQIVMLEGGHNLFLRRIGGGGAAEAFFSVLLATRGHFLWILTCRKYPWAQLEYQFQASQYFTQEVHTLFQSHAEVQQGILLRHRNSGFRLLFTDDKLVDRKLRKLRITHSLESEAVQKYLETQYFEHLFEISGGDIQAALFFWLLSVRYDEGRKTILVSPCQRLEYQFLANFERIYLFTLAELINNGGLTPDEHALIFRLPPSQSQLILDFLVALRLVETLPSEFGSCTTVYRINPVLIHPVSSTLETMNILY